MAEIARAMWTPSAERAASTNMARLCAALGLPADYDTLYAVSIAEPQRFWGVLWDFLGVVGEKGTHIVKDAERVEQARWFAEASFNLAENYLRRRDDGIAIIAIDEGGGRRVLSWAALYDAVCRVRAGMRALGIGAGDRVASCLPNVIETVVAMLATTSLGAVWTACAPEYGVESIVDRLATVAPRLLLVADGTQHGGKCIALHDKNRAVREALPSLVATIEIANLGFAPPRQHVAWSRLAAAEPEGDFARFPFDLPAVIVYSSGTTGKPKAIVHGAGGCLLATVKEMVLHCDARPDQPVFWPTNPGWMVWNVMLGSLCWGAPVVLYDGSPIAPGPTRLFDLIEQERPGIVRIVPPLIDAYRAAGLRPIDSHVLTSLRCIVSGSAPLLPHHYSWLYDAVSADVQVMSPAGGTDVMGTLASGNPMGPVIAGEIQCRSLGMAVEVWDEAGQPIVGTPGELVCTRAFPNAPLAFFGEDAGRLHATYFATFPGIWRHGDWAELTARGGVIIHGRADSTLKVKGVRIGTAEIHQAIAGVAGVRDSAAVLHRATGRDRLILFVVPEKGASIDNAFRQALRAAIRAATTARHVPDAILEVEDLLYSINGKCSETAIADAINGRPVRALAGLANPQMVQAFTDAGHRLDAA